MAKVDGQCSHASLSDERRWGLVGIIQFLAFLVDVGLAQAGDLRLAILTRQLRHPWRLLPT